MTRMTILALVAIFGFASIANAGGPVLVTEEPEVIAPAKPASSVGNVLVPLAIIVVVAVFVASQGGDDERRVKPGCKTAKGC